MRRLLAGLVIFGTAFVARAFSQDAATGSLPEAFGESALVVTMNTIVNSGDEPWTKAEVKYTIPGTPVSAKIVGTNVVVVFQVTPYIPQSGGLVLVAQGQVWVKQEGGKLAYQTTLNTIPVKFGETVFFYPLGVDARGSSPIKIEIVVTQYKKPAPAGSGTNPNPQESSANP